MNKNGHLYYYEGEIVRVVDGDTVIVNCDLGFGLWKKNLKLRFSGIDTPEKRTRNLKEKELGLKATARVKELCANKIRFISHFLDKYGRSLAIPYVINEDGTTGESICEILINEGHAVKYFGGTKTKVWGE
jgi:micrococcal nuclease